jgi:hypothetical protein
MLVTLCKAYMITTKLQNIEGTLILLFHAVIHERKSFKTPVLERSNNTVINVYNVPHFKKYQFILNIVFMLLSLSQNKMHLFMRKTPSA